MSLYDGHSEAQGEFEPGSDDRVLRNSLGITEPAEIERVETELLTIAYVDSLEWVTTSLRFTSEIILEMHGLWLGELYPKSGFYRTVNLSKGGFQFCVAAYIEREMRRFENEQLAEQTPCRGIARASTAETGPPSVEEVALSVSIVHAELLLIHPFREGNGRLGRWLADLMVLQAGYPAPEYDLDNDSKRGAYFSAMRKAYGGEFKGLSALFVSWIECAQRQLSESPRLEQ